MTSRPVEKIRVVNSEFWKMVAKFLAIGTDTSINESLRSLGKIVNPCNLFSIAITSIHFNSRLTLIISGQYLVPSTAKVYRNFRGDFHDNFLKGQLTWDWWIYSHPFRRSEVKSIIRDTNSLHTSATNRRIPLIIPLVTKILWAPVANQLHHILYHYC